MTSIGILKEADNENRVCLIPAAVKHIVNELKIPVLVEERAGMRAGFSDKAFAEAGATIVKSPALYEQAEVICSVNHLFRGEALSGDRSFIGIYNLLYHKQRVHAYLQGGHSVYSLDLLPRTSKAQSMDVLSSMASLAGYKAVIRAAELYGSVIPMFTTAAGTLRPANVVVLGAGVAGLQAIATARRLGAVVEAFDVRKAAGEEVRSLGARFIEVAGATENEDAGGYAVQQSEEYLRQQKELINERVIRAQIVICTANIPGKKAPLLIEKAVVDQMAAGSIIVDLASEQGGNCALTEDERQIDYRGIKILGSSYLAKEMPMASAHLLSNNYLTFLKHLRSLNGSAAEDPIIQGCMVIQNGQIVHPGLLNN